MTNSTDIADALIALMKTLHEDATSNVEARRLSGGASQETWKVDVTSSTGNHAYILRRSPNSAAMSSGQGIGLVAEAEILRAIKNTGVAVPKVVHVCEPDDGLGTAYLMNFIPGETIPRKILRDQAFDPIRSELAKQCGKAIGQIHKADVETLPHLPVSGAIEQLDQYDLIYQSFDAPRPVFELAFQWLRANFPGEYVPCLVHGDFRNGNLIIDEQGLQSVLDWELAHIGDPREDIGWICVNSWRFGHSENRVGGFGDLQDLLDAYYRTTSVFFTESEIRYWEILGTLKWGIMCLMMYGAFASGSDPSVERAAIGRRSSETEIDLLNLLEDIA